MSGNDIRSTEKQCEKLKEAAEKTLGLLMNLDGEINIAHVDSLTNIIWEMNEQIENEGASSIDGAQLLEYHKTVKTILKEVVANQKLTVLQQQVQEIVRPLQNGLEQMQQQAAALQAQANTLFANKVAPKKSFVERIQNYFNFFRKEAVAQPRLVSTTTKHEHEHEHEHEQQPKLKNEVHMPTTTLPKYQEVLQDVIRAFNESASVDRSGKKDYADVLFKVYQKHLEGKTPEQQKKILQGLIESLQGRSALQNMSLGIMNPLALLGISRVIRNDNAPEWIKEIAKMSYDTPEEGAQQLYDKIHKQINAIETPNGTVSIKSSAYDDFVKKHPVDEKAPSLWGRIKAFFSNIFTSIKDMFGITSDVGPERILTPQQILEKEKEALILHLNSLKIDSSEFKPIEITKRNSLAEKLGIRVAELTDHINKATNLDEFKLDVHKLNKDVAKLKDPNLNQQEIKTLLSEYLPEPQSKPTPAGSKKATMLSSIGTKLTSMEKSAEGFAKNFGNLLKKNL